MQPSSAITRLDLSVSYGEFSLINNIRRMVGLQLFPMLGVAQEAATFAKMTAAQLAQKVQDTRRAPKSAYKRNSTNWGTDTYNLEEHGLEEPVDDALLERYGDIVKAEMIASKRLIHAILLKLEYDIAAVLTDTAVFTGANAVGISTAWTTPATADPIADIDAAHDKVNAACGEDANVLQLTKKSYRAAIRTVKIVDRLKYDAAQVLSDMESGQKSNLVTRVNSGLCDLFGVEKIVVARAFKNTADEGQTASFSRVWDDTKAMLCVAHDDGMDGDLEDPRPQLGRTLFSTKNGEPLPGSNDSAEGSLIMEEYREENVRGGILRARNKRQVKTLQVGCGCLLTNVTA